MIYFILIWHDIAFCAESAVKPQASKQKLADSQPVQSTEYMSGHAYLAYRVNNHISHELRQSTPCVTVHVIKCSKFYSTRKCSALTIHTKEIQKIYAIGTKGVHDLTKPASSDVTKTNF